MKAIFFICIFCVNVCLSNVPVNETDFSGIWNDDPLQQLPVLDLKKEYPKMDPSKEAVVEIKCIPLETSPDILLDRNRRLAYISGQRIVVYNPIRGDVFLFGNNGKVLSRFNHRGKTGYRVISALAFDEKNKEVFVVDYGRKILVYSEDGIHQRDFHIPPQMQLLELYNYDDESLFAILDTDISDDKYKSKPYFFLSKKDGSIISYLPVTLTGIVPRTLEIDRTFDTMTGFTLTTAHNYKFGRDFVLADRSSDTVFLLSEGKKLTPLFVRRPSVHETNPTYIVLVGMKTDNFIKVLIQQWYPQKIKEAILKGRQPSYAPLRTLMFDLRNRQFFEYERGLYSVNKVDLAENNMAAGLWNADDLINALERGRLREELKRVASTLDEEDNPVVEVFVYK